MKCWKCNTANDDDANFCYWCGKEFTAHLIQRTETLLANISIKISNLEAQLSQKYKVISSQAYCYDRLCGNFTRRQHWYNCGAIITVYTTRDEFALTQGGWVKLTNLVKC
jgi:hypothetical protein